MYRQKVNKSETYCFRCSPDEREMIRHIQKKVDIPFELRKKIREIYKNLIGFDKFDDTKKKSKKKEDPDDLFLNLD
jgi:hypothetical protein